MHEKKQLQTDISRPYEVALIDMSAHGLLNLLNKLSKRDKMQGWPCILSLFCNNFYKFNNTRA